MNRDDLNEITVRFTWIDDATEPMLWPSPDVECIVDAFAANAAGFPVGQGQEFYEGGNLQTAIDAAIEQAVDAAEAFARGES